MEIVFKKKKYECTQILFHDGIIESGKKRESLPPSESFNEGWDGSTEIHSAQVVSSLFLRQQAGYLYFCHLLAILSTASRDS